MVYRFFKWRIFHGELLNNQTVSDFLYDISREYLELYKLLLLYILLLLICNRLLITYYDLFDDLGIASRMMKWHTYIIYIYMYI